MPLAPLKPCPVPGCPELVARGKCAKHQKQSSTIYDKTRGNSHQRGYDREWLAVRERALKRDHYICQGECLAQGRVIPAEHVDHIKPFHGRKDPLRLDVNNLQSLCRPCHSRKTAKEDGGFGRAKKVK